jgi:SNF2 family DNA or RNA helicase
MSQSHPNSDFNIDIDELSEEHPRTITPLNCKIALRPHQQTLLARCIRYENEQILLREFDQVSNDVSHIDFMRTKVGIIGDRVGSGKSYVILSLIQSNNISNEVHPLIKSHGYNKVNFFFHDFNKSINTNLLVVPHNLAVQWQYYIDNFGTAMKCKIIKLAKVLDTIGQQGDNLIDVIKEFDLIIITSTLYNKFAQILIDNKVKLQRIIFDEVDSLNIPSCKHVDANFYWLVTASYGNAIYPRGYCDYDRNVGRYIWYATGMRHSGFLKHLLSDIASHLPRSLVKTLIVKNSEAYVEASLSLPPMFTSIIRCKTPHSIRVLDGVVDRQVLQHLSADDVQGALAYINNNQRNTEENIILRVIDKFSKQATNLRLQIQTTNAMMFDVETERDIELARLQTQLDNALSKINTISGRIKSSEMCSVCYDDIQQKAIVPCCQNAFCFKCISMWVSQKHTCPLCKNVVVLADLLVVDNEASTSDCSHYEDELPESEQFDKLENLEKLLLGMKHEGGFVGKQILIFTAYDNVFASIVEVLKKVNIKHEYLKGNGNQVNAIVERYKKGSTNVLLINPRQYGSGLCLETTTDMIMFHKFDTEIEKQVIGRAQRYGRKEPLNLHYLLYTNEVEKQA